RYYYGEGVEKNYTEAVKWYRKAADKGHLDAQYNLGNRYYNGEGVEKNYTEAVKWYRKAADKGHSNAKNTLKQLGIQ
ncbi:MAG: sel1 repeat family protein, partial [Bacteroidales bacterium]|nr:sel1 repeat family protein [Bacteroidales bacterium]